MDLINRIEELKSEVEKLSKIQKEIYDWLYNTHPEIFEEWIKFNKN